VSDVKSPTEGPSLHLAGLEWTGPRIAHTIRYTNESWQPEFGRIGDTAYHGVACAGAGTDMHVVALAGGQIVHTIRYPDESWQPGSLQKVQDVVRTGGPTAFSAVACAGVGGDLHVIGVGGGRLYHTIRYAGGGWQSSFGDLNSAVSAAPSQFSAVACAGAGGDLHVIGVADGRLHHTIRYASGGWQRFNNIHQVVTSGDPGQFTAVSCAVAGDNLHVTGLAGARINHTFRDAAGRWQTSFGDVQNAIPGSPAQFSTVACAGTRTDLHVVGVAAGRAYHALRRGDGSWQPFTIVPSRDAPVTFSSLAAGAQAGTTIQFLLDGRAYFTKLKELLYKVIAGPGAQYPLSPSLPGEPTIENVLVAAGAAGRRVDATVWDGGAVLKSLFGAPSGTAFKKRLDGRATEHRGNVRVYTEPYVARTSTLAWLPTSFAVTTSAQHQKLALFSFAGRKVALVGGINIGNVDWDDAGHPVDITRPDHQPRHDTAVLVGEGTAAAVEQELDRRWSKSGISPIADPSGYYVKLGFWAIEPDMCLDSCPKGGISRSSAGPVSADPVASAPSDSAMRATGLRTISEGALPVSEIREALVQRIASAESYVYLEGFTCHNTDIILALQSRLAARPDLTVIVVLPDYGYRGDWSKVRTDERCESFWSRSAWFVLTLRFAASFELTDGRTVRAADRPIWTLTPERGPLEYSMLSFGSGLQLEQVQLGRVRRVGLAPGRKIYLCAPYRRSGGKLTAIYVHSKLAIVDDRVALVGSANFNHRSMSSDGEFSVLLEGPAVRPLIREPLFAHWGMSDAASWKSRLDAAVSSTSDGVVMLPLDTAKMYDHSVAADFRLGSFEDAIGFSSQW
jgi:phosphatidylserine/phosphatidylglycerophosphate/cardiolipin synthase-like enzyme